MALIRIIVGGVLNGVTYSKGKTYDVADEIANDLFLVRAAVAADEETASRMQKSIEWTEAPARPAPRESLPNWITRRKTA